MKFLMDQIKNIDIVSLILMFFEFLFGTSLLFSMTEGNAAIHLFFSGLSFGMAIMQMPNVIRPREEALN